MQLQICLLYTSRACSDEGDYHSDEAAGNGDGNRGVDRLTDAVEVPGAVALGDDDGGTGRHAHKQVDEQADEDTSGCLLYTSRCV